MAEGGMAEKVGDVILAGWWKIIFSFFGRWFWSLGDGFLEDAAE